jgi:predicted nucleic acid-binding protein
MVAKDLLLDTSFLLALWLRRDKHHQEALSFA